jgi:HlyD family secretion protein
MNTAIFRNVALERLASPEQLDQALRMTTPKGWLGLLGIYMVVVTAIAWGYEGSIPTTAMGQGVIVRTGGVLNIVTRGSGLVVSLNVTPGQRIQHDQVVATVAQPELLEKSKVLREEMAEAREQQERTLRLHTGAVKLQIEALERERANSELQITELNAQAELAKQDIPVEDQLLAKGLVTKQQTINARQKVVGIQDQIEEVRAHLKQLDAQRFSLESQPQQEDLEMRLRVSSLERSLAGIEKVLSIAQNVVSPYAGEVLELKVYPGSSVVEGQSIVSIQPDRQNLELLAYVAAAQAKDVKTGMEVQVAPSSAKREEYGFMTGKVTFVADYPATSAALMRNFQNELLVSALSSSGPVTELRVALDPDESTPSGFRWSSSRGPLITISSGTICNVQIVTHRQKPITLVLPYVKERLGLD